MCLAVASVGAVGACGGAQENFGDWESRFWWGAHVAAQEVDESYATGVERLERRTGVPMTAARVYRRWEDGFPADTERYLRSQRRLIVLSIKPIRADGTRIAWADLAAVSDGDPLFDELAAWAERIRRFGRPIYVTVHHEPETVDDVDSGTTADYVAAWRRFAELLRERGGPHARLMWIMTDQSFTVPPLDRQAATAWYPGDDVVDAIGVDAFNWFTCRGRSEGWRSAAELVEPARRFALGHPDKELWIAELGSVDDPARPNRKADWLRDAARLPTNAGWGQLRGVLYFDDVHGPEFPDCDWRITDRSSDAFGALADVPVEPATTIASATTATP